MKKVQVWVTFIMMMFVAMCFAGCKSDMEKKIEDAKAENYSVEIRTDYSAEDEAERYIVCICEGERILERYFFDCEGELEYHDLNEYDSEGKITKWLDYTIEKSKEELSRYIIYEYDDRGNCTTESICNRKGEPFNINRYRYDEQNRKVSLAEDVPEGITQEVYYTTHYIYDELGRLSREEKYATGKPHSYVVYEYQESQLIKREEYSWGYKGTSDSYRGGQKYEYDTEGKLIKCLDYDKNGNCTGYTTYEYK